MYMHENIILMLTTSSALLIDICRCQQRRRRPRRLPVVKLPQLALSSRHLFDKQKVACGSHTQTDNESRSSLQLSTCC